METTVKSGCVEQRHDCWGPGSLHANVISHDIDPLSPTSVVTGDKIFSHLLVLLGVLRDIDQTVYEFYREDFCTGSLMVSLKHVGWCRDCWGPGPHLNIRTVFWIRRCRRTLASKKSYTERLNIGSYRIGSRLSTVFSLQCAKYLSLCLLCEVSQYTWRHGHAPSGFPVISRGSLMFWQTTHWFCIQQQWRPRIGIEIFCTNGQTSPVPKVCMIRRISNILSNYAMKICSQVC